MPRAVTGAFAISVVGANTLQSKRGVRNGDIESEMTLMSEVDASVYAKGTVPAIDPAPIDMDDEIAARARKIRALPIGERIYMQGQILGVSGRWRRTSLTVTTGAES